MRILTLKEPYASLIAKGFKSIETRSWKTNYRGEIYIHAGISKSHLDNKNADFYKIIEKLECAPGYVLCKCNLVDCIEMTDEYIEDIKKNHYADYLCGAYEQGRYAWVLKDVEVITPFSVKGKLGIWNYNIEKEKLK